MGQKAIHGVKNAHDCYNYFKRSCGVILFNDNLSNVEGGGVVRKAEEVRRRTNAAFILLMDIESELLSLPMVSWCHHVVSSRDTPCRPQSRPLDGFIQTK